MLIHILLLIISLQFLTTQCLAAEIDNTEAIEDTHPLEEISGIVSDRTITLIGHEFYRHFTNYRHLHTPDSEYNLTVFERPSARWGSLVWVEYQSKKLYQTFLSPGRTTHQQMAEQAAQQLEEKLNKIKLQELLSDHIDLERDEL